EAAADRHAGAGSHEDALEKLSARDLGGVFQFGLPAIYLHTAGPDMERRRHSVSQRCVFSPLQMCSELGFQDVNARRLDCASSHCTDSITLRSGFITGQAEFIAKTRTDISVCKL